MNKVKLIKKISRKHGLRPSFIQKNKKCYTRKQKHKGDQDGRE